jgi:beta-lactam-binding protein with PASTA domain
MKVNAVLLVFLLVVAAGCGSERRRQVVPDVRGERLDVAERQLDATGLEFDRLGGGAFGILVRSHWFVCSQQPHAGKLASKVTLVVDRSCPPVAPPVVPDLVGLRVRHAEVLLAKLDVRFEAVPLPTAARVASDWVVCDQQPPGGERAAELTLFAAPSCRTPPPVTVVPNVLGEDLDDALLLLRAAGVRPSISPAVPGERVRSLWEVCTQNPPPGDVGSHVDLTVGRDC